MTLPTDDYLGEIWILEDARFVKYYFIFCGMLRHFFTEVKSWRE